MRRQPMPVSPTPVPFGLMNVPPSSVPVVVSQKNTPPPPSPAARQPLATTIGHSEEYASAARSPILVNWGCAPRMVSTQATPDVPDRVSAIDPVGSAALESLTLQP